MNTTNIYRFLSALAVLSFLHTGAAYPLGLGEISVKGSPDGLLRAEIPLLLGPGEGDVKASVGSDADYRMMKLPRPGFLDSLIVSVPERDGNNKRKIVVTSNLPLRVPSFELVIRVTAGGGTIIEKFFLALDFRKTLSLELPKQKTAAQPSEIVPAKTPKKEERKSKNISVSKLADEPQALTKQDPPSISKLVESPDKTVAPKEAYLTVQPGDTLYGIAYRLKTPKNLRHGAVVGLHAENPDAFIRGDINRLKVGSRIYYGDVNRLAKKYAGKAIPTGKSKRGLDDDYSQRPEPFTLISPLVESVPAEDIAAFTSRWREDWVSSNGEKFSENYSTDFHDSRGRDKKRFLRGRIAFNRKNENIKIDFENISILRTGRYATVYFTQWFRSDTFASVGLKKLTIEKTPKGLKIIDEEFVPKRSATGRHPWVVYIAYAEDIGRAREIISSLKSAGYEAFEARSFQSPGKGYRIFVGRSGGRIQAEKISAGLKEKGKKPAKVLEFPFSLEAGVFTGREKADLLNDRLLEKGLSPYIVESIIDGEMKYGVHVGAYVSETGAETAMKTINNKEFSLKISKP